MSLYGKYVKELLGRHIVETGWGFATYSFHNDGCYIEEIYVDPDTRRNGDASRMANEISSIAREKGCKFLYGSVRPASNGSTISMEVLLAYGFKLDSSTDNFILMKKEL